MSSSLDVSLDDIIRKNKRSEEHNRHFGSKTAFASRSGPGPDLRDQNRKPFRNWPYPTESRPTHVLPGRLTWKKQTMPSGGINRETEGKLYISNLDYDVSNDDLKLLFSDFGELKRYSIHYDRSGRSMGTAEVTYSTQANALAAIRRYNNMNLDGKPMKIELVEVGAVAPDFVPPTRNRILGRPNEAFRSARGSGSGGHEFDTGYKLGNHHGKNPTAEDLDAELENYHLETKR